MKTLLTLLLLLSAPNSWADCLNLIPESVAQLYISNPTSPGVPITCKDRPLEPCLCFDGVKSWKAAEITAGPVKTIIVNPAKQAAEDAKEAQAKSASEAATAARKALFSGVDNAKSLDDLRAILKALLQEMGKN